MQADDKVVISEHDFRRRFVYDQDSLLGEGGFAKVYRAHDRQFDETVALKFYTNSEAGKYDIIREMRESRKFTHKNIIRVYDARIVRFTNSFGMTENVQVGILEYANAGNLYDFLRSAPSEEAFKRVIIGILQGLHYLHTELRVIHRDLSPDNILMMKEQDQWIPKIADFGISKRIDMKTINMGDKKASSELVGKMEYMAPEQFDPGKYGIKGRITTNVDLWSFGVILTEVFTDTSPFGDRNTAQSPMQIMHNVLHQTFPSEIKGIPEPYRKVIRNCLVRDAKKRAQSSLELVNIINTPVKKKKIAHPMVFVAAAILLIGLGIVAWIGFGPSKEPATENTQIGSVASVEKPIVDTVKNTSLQTKEKPPLSKEDSLTKLPEDNDQLIAQAADTAASDIANPIKVVKPTPAPFDKADLLDRLLREIESSDNYVIDERIRLGRINRHVQRYFTNNQVPVLVRSNGETQEFTAQDFFEYIVRTAMETREWEINTAQTKLKGEKVSELMIEQQ